jgi:putative Holliday junction resolvase
VTEVATDWDRSDIGPRGRVVGVDLGTRRVGVAVTDGDQRVATTVTTLLRRGDTAREHRELVGLAEEYEAVGVVVGLPRSLSGELGPAARRALEEIAVLRAALGVPVEAVDERLSTVTAAAGLRAAGRRSKDQRAVIDAAAAAVLLQAWVDRRARSAR